MSNDDMQFWRSLGLFLAMYHFNTSSAQRPLAVSQHSEFGVIVNLTQSKLEDITLASQHSSSTKAGEPSTTGTWKNTFLLQIHCLLSEAEKDGMAHIASFCVHGRAFKIHNLDLFVEKLLPRLVTLGSQLG
jgi:hypothetical protein